MAHNQEMLEHRGKDWGDKVRIIGISIDSDAETVMKHVKKNKWEDVEHYHRAGSDCSKQYSVSGVPHVMLVDKEGKLAFIGHPATRKLEEDIDKLIKGEKLTGEGTGPSVEDDEAVNDDTSEYKELDLARIASDFEKFLSGFDEMMKDKEV